MPTTAHTAAHDGAGNGGARTTGLSAGSPTQPPLALEPTDEDRRRELLAEHDAGGSDAD